MPHQPETYRSVPDTDKSLQLAADRCVMCGLCLPHCPTYALKQRETDAPRGRISLMRALAAGQLNGDAKLVSHLESCTLCRRCESVCPAEVPFGNMMDTVRKKLFEAGQARACLPRWLHLLIVSRTLRQLCVWWIRVYRGSGLRRLLRWMDNRKLNHLTRWETVWPPEVPPLKYADAAIETHPATTSKEATAETNPATAGKSVALFTGCIAEMMDRETLTATANLLLRAGFEVRIPATQVCCGALHQHAGNKRCADALSLKNTMAFSDADILISCASGCGIHLHEQQKQLDIVHFDIITFLSRHTEKLHFSPLPVTRANKRVALHLPCTARYQTEVPPALEKLLAQLPGFTYQHLPDTLSCCGAAGAYMLTHSESSAALADRYLDFAEKHDIDILLTLNIGCAAHFRQNAAARGLELEILHPVVLLSQQLSNQRVN